MTLAVQQSHTPARFSLLPPLARLFDAFISARQKQADNRVARYLREIPDPVLHRLGVSRSDIARLRDSSTGRGGKPHGLHGRVDRTAQSSRG